MVALVLPLPSSVAVVDDAKGQTSPCSTNASQYSRSASEAEESEVAELSSLDEEIKSLEWHENARLKAEINRLARRNLDLRIKLLEKENAFLRAHVTGDDYSDQFGGTAEAAEPLSAPCFPPGVWMSSSPEDAQLAAMAAWNAHEPLWAHNSRSSRRRAARRKAKTMYAPSHTAVLDSWTGQWPSVSPFQPNFQAPPGLTGVTYEDDDDELVVTLGDSEGEEDEEDEWQQ